MIYLFIYNLMNLKQAVRIMCLHVFFLTRLSFFFKIFYFLYKIDSMGEGRERASGRQWEREKQTLF